MTRRTRSAMASFAMFIAGGFSAFGMVTLLGLAQQLDERDAEVAAGQVMACSSLIDACAAAREPEK